MPPFFKVIYVKVYNKAFSLYNFQNGNEGQNIWGKNWSYNLVAN
jgi:hypothetical protein